MKIDLKVVLRELLGLVDLTKAQVFYIHKLTEIIMISKAKNLVFAVFQVVLPSLKGLNNDQELWIIFLEKMQLDAINQFQTSSNRNDFCGSRDRKKVDLRLSD